TSAGVSFKCLTRLGEIDGLLDWQHGNFLISVAPEFCFSFDALFLTVSIDVGGKISNQVNVSGYSQQLSFWFEICGAGFTVGPVSWGIPLVDMDGVRSVFAWFFGDMVKSFFQDTLAAGAVAAFNWVKNNLTDLAEEAIELFKAAGTEISTIAKNA